MTTTPASNRPRYAIWMIAAAPLLLGAGYFAAPYAARQFYADALADTERTGRVVELTIVAAPQRLSVVPGTTSDVFAFNGQVPGPTLEFNEGDSVVVHFRNDLPEPSSIHWHGLYLPFTEDGSPFHPVEPGGSHDYVFVVRRGAAGTYWYHPHPHHRTGLQVAKGLYGAIVVRSASDPLPPMKERVLLLSDNRVDSTGNIDIPPREHARGRVDSENGREGNVLLVSGKVMPTLDIRSGEVQRWRVINASAARVYRIALEGHKLLHIGNDGGLFEQAREVDELTVGVGERVEFLVRGTAVPGSRAVLQALPYDRYIPQTRPEDWSRTRQLAALHYDSIAATNTPALPATLRYVPPIDTTTIAARRTMVLTQHLINGKSMDMHRIDASAKLGTTEIWDIENLVGMDHPFHLHGLQFQVLSRDGVPEPYRSWKDVVNVPKHQTARIAVHFDGFPGKWMFHCHILDHEDHGMMGVLEVKR